MNNYAEIWKDVSWNSWRILKQRPNVYFWFCKYVYIYIHTYEYTFIHTYKCALPEYVCRCKNVCVYIFICINKYVRTRHMQLVFGSMYNPLICASTGMRTKWLQSSFPQCQVLPGIFGGRQKATQKNHVQMEKYMHTTRMYSFCAKATQIKVIKVELLDNQCTFRKHVEIYTYIEI